MMKNETSPNVEQRILLNKFKPRWYQIPIIRALEKEKYRKLLCILPRRCLSPDTHILLYNGSFKEIRNIKIGDKILSHNGTNIEIDTVVNVWETDPKETATVRSGRFLPIKSSLDHRFASVNTRRGTITWKKIKDTSIYSFFMNYAGFDTSAVSNPELAEFIGYMSSDGNLSPDQQPCFTNKNLDILNRVEYLAKKLFKAKTVRYKHGDSYRVGFSRHVETKQDYLKNPIKEFFKSNNQCVQKYSRPLNPVIWEMDFDSVKRFIAALISGDGNLYIQKKGFKAKDTSHVIPPGIELTISCGVCDQYGWDIYWLLRKFGIVPNIPYKERGSNWKVKVSNCSGLFKLLYDNYIYGKNDIRLKILSIIKNYKKERTIIKDCYKSRVKFSENKEKTRLFDIKTEKNHNFFANGYLVHNSGKDIVALNLAIRQLLSRVCTVFYVFPTYSQARKALWDAIDIQGEKILDYIPEQLIKSRNSSELKITMLNGSILQFIGSDNYDRLRGTNPYGVIFSEYSTQNPMAYSTVRPILAANGGWVMFVSTPFGKNHFWDLYQIAENSNDWFSYRLTLDDTQHIPMEEIESLRASGEMSEAMIQQEFFCSFSQGVEGAYFAKIINELRLNNRIGDVPYEGSFPVHTSWDIGYTDATAIIFFQVIGKSIHIIDYYENNNMSIEGYVDVIKSKPYRYGKHIGPHDIINKNSSNGLSPMQIASQLGLTFIKGVSMDVQSGIQMVRSKLPTFWIDERKCSKLIKVLENYRQIYNHKKMDFEKAPFHNWASHGADSARLMCTSLSLVSQGASAEELNARYNRVMYGRNNNSFNPLG